MEGLQQFLCWTVEEFISKGQLLLSIVASASVTGMGGVGVIVSPRVRYANDTYIVASS